MAPKKQTLDRRKRFFGKAEGSRLHYWSRLYMVRTRSETVDRLVSDIHRDMAIGGEPIEELPDAELSDSERRQAMERERFNRELRRRRPERS